MTTNLDIANRALQVAGTRTNMTLTEFTNQTSNEAIQCQLIMFKLRDELTRMAPWDCTRKYANLTFITSTPTTPENPGGNPPMWVPGLPAPPWAYEYQYPVDCLRAIKILPQYTSLVGNVPIYPNAVATGISAVGWVGPALKFDVSTDDFFNVTAATIVAGGLGYAVGDIIYTTQPTFTSVLNFPPLTNQLSPQVFVMPVGSPAALQVTSVGAGGAVTGVSIVPIVADETTPFTGSYFAPVTGTQAQGFTTGNGTGATFTLTFSTSSAPQRVILCNQEQAMLCYNRQIIDPNLADPLFQDAWINILASRLSKQLTGNIGLANQLIAETNTVLTEARKADGNEGIMVNDVTPDFLRIRGNWGGPNWEYSPNLSFDWGSLYSPY